MAKEQHTPSLAMDSSGFAVPALPASRREILRPRPTPNPENTTFMTEDELDAELDYLTEIEAEDLADPTLTTGRRRRFQSKTIRAEPTSKQDKYATQTHGGLMAIRDLLLDENARLEKLLNVAQDQAKARKSTSTDQSTTSDVNFLEIASRQLVYPNRSARLANTTQARPVRLRVHKNTLLPRPYAAPKALFSIDDETSTLPTTPQLEAKLAYLLEAEKERLVARLKRLEEKIETEDLYLPEELPRVEHHTTRPASHALNTSPLPRSPPPNPQQLIQAELELRALHQIIIHLSSESHTAKLDLHRDREELKQVASDHLELIRSEVAQNLREGEDNASEPGTAGFGTRNVLHGDVDLEDRMDVNMDVENGLLVAENHRGGAGFTARQGIGAESIAGVGQQNGVSAEQEMVKAFKDLRGYVDVLIRYWNENSDLPPPGIYQTPTYPTLNAPPIPSSQLFPRRPHTTSAAIKATRIAALEKQKAELERERNVEANEGVDAADESRADGESNDVSQHMPDNLKRALRLARQAVQREGIDPGLSFGLSAADQAAEEALNAEEETDEPDELEEAFRVRVLKRKLASRGLELDEQTLRDALARSRQHTAGQNGDVALEEPFDPSSVPGDTYQSHIMLHQLYAGAEEYRNRPPPPIIRPRRDNLDGSFHFDHDDASTYKAFDEEDPSWKRNVPYHMQFEERRAQSRAQIGQGGEGISSTDLHGANAIMAATLSGAINAGGQGHITGQDDSGEPQLPGMATNPDVGPCANCGRAHTTVWRALSVSGKKYKVCNPCGLHFNKNNVMRPPSYWSTDAPRSRQHRNPKVPKERSGKRGRPKGSLNGKRDGLRVTDRLVPSELGANDLAENEVIEDEAYDSMEGSPAAELEDMGAYEIDTGAMPANQEALDGFMRHLYSNVQAGNPGPFAEGFDAVNANVTALLEQHPMGEL